ncbi:MAG TPA: hypothetical protein VF824_03775 [Thermoanaerobaculia bacterium]|jgi:hypothetical protein
MQLKIAFDPLLTAIAGAVSAIVVAYFTALFAGRRESKGDRRQHAVQVEHDEAMLLAQFLKSAATEIQTFRDTLQMIVRAPAGTISAESVVEDIKAAGAGYIRLYREYVGAVPSSVAALTHEVKNVILACEDRVREAPFARETLLFLDDAWQELRLTESKIVAIRLEHLQRYTRAAEGK